MSEPTAKDVRTIAAAAPVLAAFLSDVGTHCQYCGVRQLQGSQRGGYELRRATGYRSGKLYPILHRLERIGLLEAELEVRGPGERRPARRLYRLTDEGMTVVQGLPAVEPPPLSWLARILGRRILGRRR